MLYLINTIYTTLFAMSKSIYISPLSEISRMMGENIICASGTNGSNEDFGKGTGFSFDLFESIKLF